MRTPLVIGLLLMQAAGSRPAVLSGRVVRLGSNAGVSHAQIVAAKVGGAVTDYRTAVADAEGHFTLAELAPGSYRVYASREGYLRGEHGRRGVGASGVPVTIFEGQGPPALLIPLTPTAVIAGRVLDQGGRPVRNGWVRALKPRYYNGERTLQTAEWAQTDDRGEYRLFDLSPGSYFVVAVPPEKPRVEGNELVTPSVPSTANQNSRQGRSPLTKTTVPAAAFDSRLYPPVYHPGTVDPSGALPVHVRAGETTTGVDFTLLTSKTFHVRGRIDVAGAGPSPELLIRIGEPDLGGMLRIPSPPVDATGAFDFPRVPPGRYRLSAQTKVPPGPLLTQVVQVDVVDRDVDGVSISLRPGVTVAGRLSIAGRSFAPTDPPTSVQLQGFGGGSGYGAVRVAADGTFRIENVMAREYRLRVIQGPGPGPWVQSARLGEDDVSNGAVRIPPDLQGRELEIVLGESSQTIEAVVLDGDRKPASGVLVIAVPDRARRSESRAYRSVTTGADGRARLDGLAPGEYLLFATESIEAGDWQDPAVLQREEGRGTPIRVREGATTPVTLRISS